MSTPAAAASATRPRARPPLVQAARNLAALAWLAVLTLAAMPVQMLALRRGWRLAATLPVWWHRRVLAALDIRVGNLGQPCRDRPLLITPNHLSWLDINLIGSLMPLSFVAKAEVADWPLFGLLAKLQRTVFVDRTRRTDTARANGEIAARLARGDAIVLFPEGTSSDGTHVLPFRSALIGAARAALADGGHARVWVQPLAIAVTRLDGLPIGRAGRPLVAWYGDTELMPHLIGVILAGPIDIDLVWGEPMPFDDATDRKLLARTLRQSVQRLLAAALAGREPVRPGLPGPVAPTGLAVPSRPGGAVASTP